MTKRSQGTTLNNYNADVLGRIINAPIQTASPWSVCGEVKQKKIDGLVQGSIKLQFYNTEVLGSEGQAEKK